METRAVPIANQFWRRWLKEFLPTIQLRKKWLKSNDNLKLQDVVIVVDENAPRKNWSMGIVTETFPGKDGLVRSVRLKTRCGEITRPVDKLCLILRDNDKV